MAEQKSLNRNDCSAAIAILLTELTFGLEMYGSGFVVSQPSSPLRASLGILKTLVKQLHVRTGFTSAEASKYDVT